MFSEPMILPILGDTKTVTRRTGTIYEKWKKGDTLWVRETWRAIERESDAVDGILFRADLTFVPIENTAKAAERWVVAYDNGKYNGKWRPCIHMPRWASRINLRLTDDTRRERLHEITNEEAVLEGAHELWLQEGEPGAWWTMAEIYGGLLHARTPRDAFRKFWCFLHGGASWEENPLVWRIPFRRIEKGVAL